MFLTFSGLLTLHWLYRKCGPRLSAEAAEKLKTNFVLIRQDARSNEAQHGGKRSAIPITVRQLEAIVRISESLAKMQLEPFATVEHVDEALRLFRVSTFDAAITGTSSTPDAPGADGVSKTSLDDMIKIEAQVKRRFPLGSRVSEAVIIENFVKQNYPEAAVRKVINVMLRRGELEHHLQRRVLYRVR